MKNFFALVVLLVFFHGTAQNLSVSLEGDTLSAPETTDLNGFVPITFTSGADQEFNFSVNRLKEGVDAEAFVEVSKATNASFAEGSTTDPRPLMAEFLGLASLSGGVLAKPDETVTAHIKLEPGIYVIEATPNESGEDYFYSVLTVTDGEDLAAPEADLNLVMVDHHFSFPATLKAGTQRWQVSNTGEQVHFAVFFKLADGATTDDLMNFFASAEPSGPPPIDMQSSYTGLIQAISSGESFYVDVNVPPGNYVAICFLPDMESEKTHLELGMMSSFTAE